MRFLPIFIAVSLTLAFSGCNSNQQSSTMSLSITKEPFGQLADGKKADLYTLTNANGMVAKITNYGGIITHLTAPDKDGKWEDVVLGFDDLASYEAGHPFFGAMVGRYGNRIAKGKFTLDGATYSLAINNGPNSLHGGLVGFDKAIWAVEEVKSDSTVGLRLTHVSPDGDEGYPGKLDLVVTYTLSNDNSIKIDYEATTDKPTVINLTNHTYFNLTGLKRDILAHELTLDSDSIVPVSTELIPTGELRAVVGTPFDFTSARVVGKSIDDTTDVQIKNGGGYDHCWVINGGGESLKKFAALHDPESGRYMEAFTTEPGVQIYTANFLDGKLKGKGVTYTRRYGICLETQHYPDSPNQPQFPTVVLRSGGKYETSTVYKFSAK